MRYDTPIYFQNITEGEYDTTTGNYVQDKTEETKVYANITDTKTDTLSLVYGGIKQGGLTIRLQQPFKKAFDFIRIDKKRYKTDYSRNNKIFVVSEVQ